MRRRLLTIQASAPLTSRAMSLRPLSSRIAVALLASVAAAALIFPDAVLAGPHGAAAVVRREAAGSTAAVVVDSTWAVVAAASTPVGEAAVCAWVAAVVDFAWADSMPAQVAVFIQALDLLLTESAAALLGIVLPAMISLAMVRLAGPAAHALAGRSLAAVPLRRRRRTIAAGGGLRPRTMHSRRMPSSAAPHGHHGAQFAHNQFAARNFHGLHNFNHTGFNRNAFGDPGHWNRWGGRFWGAGWNHWGWGWGGWAGPVFWPFLFGDIFSFVVWPYDYYDPFWAFGPDFILVSIFAPGPYFGPDYGYAPDYTEYLDYPDIYYGGGGYSGRYAGRSPGYRSPTEADRQALAETNAAATESCNALAPGVSDLPIERIKNTVRPTGDQLAALDDLSAATAKANDAIRASCPTAVPLTPMARLDAAEARLQTMIQAVDIVREPLQRFHVLLSDEQRQRFNAMGVAGGHRLAATWSRCVANNRAM